MENHNSAHERMLILILYCMGAFWKEVSSLIGWVRLNRGKKPRFCATWKRSRQCPLQSMVKGNIKEGQRENTKIETELYLLSLLSRIHPPFFLMVGTQSKNVGRYDLGAKKRNKWKMEKAGFKIFRKIAKKWKLFPLFWWRRDKNVSVSSLWREGGIWKEGALE